MIRILQISDIHFKKLSDARDEYTQLKERLFEKLKEIRKHMSIDCIMICGDVAFSGNKIEYEQKAKEFIDKFLALTNCQAAQVYMVPGNHDKNRDADYQNTRWYLRESMLLNEDGYQHFFSLYMDENDVYAKWLLPFEDYIGFANDYRCVSQSVANTRSGLVRKCSDKFHWEDVLTLGKYKLRLHGINSCYFSDREDDKHDQILPKELYHTTLNKDVVNISIMHHPLEFIKDKSALEKEIDTLYPIQFYGHIHRQTIEHNGVLKIYSGAIMPPKGEGNGEDEYEPVFNLVEFDEGPGTIIVVVKPYKWKWISNKDGRFEPQKECGPYEIAVDNDSDVVEEHGKSLKLPQGVNQRNIEIDFLQSVRSDEIIMKMYNDFVFGEDAVADASTFFDRVRKDDRYVDLYNYIHE